MTRVSDLSLKNKYIIPIEKCEILQTARKEQEQSTEQVQKQT